MNEKDSNQTLREPTASQEPVQTAAATSYRSRTRNPVKKYKLWIMLLVVAVAALGVLFTRSLITTRSSGAMTPQGIREISDWQQ